MLVGLEFWSDDDGHLLALRPLYRTLKGLEHTRPYGTKAPAGGRTSRILARPGYAVGGLRVPEGRGLDEVTIVFMRVNGDRLNPADRYLSHCSAIL